jgi:hypothetical protein
MLVIAARTAVLSVITGGGKWVEIATRADPLYQRLIVTVERKFWRAELARAHALLATSYGIRIIQLTSLAWTRYAASLSIKMRVASITRSSHRSYRTWHICGGIRLGGGGAFSCRPRNLVNQATRGVFLLLARSRTASTRSGVM